MATAPSLADVIVELGYNSSATTGRFKDLLLQFPKLSEEDLARLIGTVAQTHSGLDDSHGLQGPFVAAFSSAAAETGPLSTWNLSAIVEAVHDMYPDLSFAAAMRNLDYPAFNLPDQKSFLVLMTLYSKSTKELFPLDAVIGRVWKNTAGQVSFLRHAVSAPPEVFSFAHSSRKQAPVEGLHGHKSPLGTPNQCWLSLDLLEVLCQLAEVGQGAHTRSLLDAPLKVCPEVLLLGMAQLKANYGTLQTEVFSALLPAYLAIHPNSSIVLHRVWPLQRDAILKCMVEVHAKDNSQVSRMLDICQDLKVLPTVLDNTPFSFAIDLAALASRREYLNLEKWLQDATTVHKGPFLEACLTYVTDKSPSEGNAESPARAGAPIPLSPETAVLFLKVIHSNAKLLSPGMAEKAQRAFDAAAQANPRLRSAEQTPAESFAADVEEEANSYFQKIYTGQHSIDEIVDMLKRFSKSQVAREGEIFACMIHNLFDEYRFFPKYPDKELKITAVLFGSLISHQLVSSVTLGLALRYVLDALRKPLESKMFSFGLTALGQFMSRLEEWPQYCNHLLQINHLREAHPELVVFVENALERHERRTAAPAVSSNTLSQNLTATGAEVVPAGALPRGEAEASRDAQQGPSVRPSPARGVGSAVDGQASGTGTSKALPSVGAITVEEAAAKPEAAQPEGDRINKDGGSGGTGTGVGAGGQLNGGSEAGNKAGGGAPPTSGAAAVASSRAVPRPGSSQGQSRQPQGGFGHALNIETLMAAAEKRDGPPIEAPSQEVQDKIAFLINNISTSNIEQKSKELLELLKESNHPWFAQYMVMRRASIEPNFHELYLAFLDKFNDKSLQKEVVKATYENCKVLLRSDLIKTSSEERSLLKNLGSWLGKLTIGRNQPLRAKEIDPKALIIEAYEKGRMIAVVPFTSKVLEPCQTSIAYQPPNPWTMGILSLLAEIYSLPDLKMNLKFDIEVLFKNLHVELKDVKPTQLLQGRRRDLEGNQDFSNKGLAAAKALAAMAEPTPTPPKTPPKPPTPPAKDQTVSNPPEAPSSQPLAPKPSTPLVPPAQPLNEERAPAEKAGSTQAAAPTPSPSSFAGQGSLSIPNLSAYIVYNSKLAGLTHQLQLPRVVSLAMERAIVEIITPVVDRSVTIACMTTRELVLKDYALEAEENRTHKAANLMVASLAGSLAHVTCKEPLRVALASHLRTLLQAAANMNADILEQAVQLITNDNLDLACAVVEKAATEKALRDLEESLKPSLNLRRKQREALGPTFFEATLMSQTNLARLPEALRPKPGRLSTMQQRVYEDFSRLPWQNQQAVSSPTPSSTSPSPGPIASGPRPFSGGAPPGAASLAASPFPGLGSQQPGMGLAEELERSILAAGPLESITRPADQVSLEVGARDPERGPATGPVEPSGQLLSPQEVLEKYQIAMAKLDSIAVQRPERSYTSLSPDDALVSVVNEVPAIVSKCVKREEAALGIAQKVVKLLYESVGKRLHFTAYLAMLEGLKDITPRLTKELAGWVRFADDERKLNKEVISGLLQSELLHTADYNLHLTELMDGGRNAAATDFAIYLVKTLVVQDPSVDATELYSIIDALAKIAQRPGAPPELQQLVDRARSPAASAAAAAAREERRKAAREKKVGELQAAVKEEDKLISREPVTADPPGLREQVAGLFDEWVRACEASGTPEKAYPGYFQLLQQAGVLKNDETCERFFRILTELAVGHSLGTEASSPSGVSFTAIDLYAKLPLMLIKYYPDPASGTFGVHFNLLQKVLAVTVRIIQRDAADKAAAFNARPYFRLLVTWLMDLNVLDAGGMDTNNLQVLSAFGSALLSLQPLRVPSFSFAWLELMSHRMLMPKLLLVTAPKGWPLFQRLLLALFAFMEPYLGNAELTDSVRLLYKGTLRVLLVLLHDFPEFLCDHHFSFCNVIPASCIQMRNLILSAFPRNMRLPDPFTPNLKVDLLPEISQAPRILSDVEVAFRGKPLKQEVDEYLKNRQPQSFLNDLAHKLLASPQEAALRGTRYNVPLINCLVLYVGMQALQQLQSKAPQQLAVPTAPITHSAPMDIFQRLVVELDTEGRYLFLNAIANQLRYPNNHTHYFSCVLLYLFAEATQEVVQEQITRVLLERLIVNRPHPWGLLITFIELIKNPRYNFWSHSFCRCAPEIEKLFESVARSCSAQIDTPGALPANEQIKV